MKKHTALKPNIKNDTCIEFRRDIKALTLLADTTFSGNSFHNWITRTEKKITNPVVSKLFEMAILDRFSKFFETSDHQYGFKKHLSCRDAIYTLRQVTERYISNGSTDNNFFMCRPALDLSKAFDRTDNYVLLIKLMYRNLQKFGTRYLFLLFFSFCIKAHALRYDTIRDAILTFARKPT